MLGETQYNIIQHNTVILQNTDIEKNDRIAVMIWWYYNWIHNDGCMSECMMTFQNHKRKTTGLLCKYDGLKEEIQKSNH